MRFTPAQQRVINDPSPQILVVAGAGSGKTSVLTARYVHLLEQGHTPDQLLTITFTRKAAAEMKARIVRALRQRGNERAAQIAETGPIQTIHSFCERTLRENALAAGLNPDFKVLTGPELEVLQREVILSCLARALSGSPVLQQFAVVRPVHASQDPYSTTIETLLNLVSLVREGIFSRGYWRSVAESAEALRQHVIAGLMEELRDTAPEIAMRFADAEYAAWPGLWTDRTIAKRLDSGPHDTTKDADPAALQAHAEVLRLALGIADALDEAFDARAVLDYSGLMLRTTEVLELAPVRARLAAQYRHVLVDESQDISPDQDRLLRAMGLPNELRVGDGQQSIYGFRGADVRLFNRLRDERTVLPLTANFRSDAGVRECVNAVFSRIWPDYRPMEGPPTAPRPPTNPSDPADPFDTGDDASLGPFDGVTRWIINGEKTDLPAIAAAIAELRAETEGTFAVLLPRRLYAGSLRTALDALGVANSAVDLTDQFYARREVRDLAHTLTAIADPFSDFDVLAMLRSDAVGISVDGLVTLAQTSPVVDSMADIPLLRQFDRARIDECLAWYRPLRHHADRMTAWEVLSQVFKHSPYLSRIAAGPDGKRAVSNARKLLAMAATMPDRGPAAFAERIWEIESLSHREGDAPTFDPDDRSIQFMTIHKSKGLEFDHVVLMDLGQEVSRRLNTTGLEKHPNTGLFGIGTLDPGSLLSQLAAYARKRTEREEAERRLYVAMTRAKRQLILVTPKVFRKGSLGHPIQRALNEGLNLHTRSLIDQTAPDRAPAPADPENAPDQ
ncbi:MAG: UvrD-helicase domain-containing protein [Fimbriimonadaceae bacterium]|nr:UvrD-helicase domain-containing protein [Fimbriimonadaceae bacterium]